MTKQPISHWRNQKGNKKYLEMNKNKNIMIQNLWDAAKARLREKVVVIQAYHKKQEKSQVNYLSLHLKELEN